MSVGQIVGGIVGGVIGFVVAGPAGAFQGAMLGSAIGGGFTPGSLPTVEGPRLSDLRAQSSEYGRPIPIVYGTIGISGNIIEAFDLTEVKTETEQGGGYSQPSQVSRSYSYFADFAVLVCEGEADVLRIWAGAEKRLIYDGFVLEGGGTIRIYNGSETQLPDPLLESYHGVGNVPAYRGYCYIVFEQFPVAKDGNMIPFLTIEVSTAGHTCGQNYTNVDVGGGTARLYDPAPVFVSRFQDRSVGKPAQDPNSGMLYYLRSESGNLYLDKTDPSSRAFVGTIMLFEGVSNGVMALNDVMNKIMVINAAQYALVDLGDFTAEYGTFATAKQDILCIDGGYILLNASTIGGVDPSDNWGRVGIAFGGYLIDCDGTVACVSPLQELTLGGAPVPGIQKSFSIFDPVARRLISFSDSCYYDIDSGELTELAAEFPYGIILNPTYNPYIRRIFGGVEGVGIVVMDPAQFSAENGFPIECVIFAGTMLYSSDPSDVVQYSYDVRPVVLPTNQSYMAFVDGGATSTFSDVFLFKVGNVGAGMILGEIVADLCERADMTSYATSALTDMVDGYAIAKQTDVRAAIDALRPVYYFDAVESGGVVKFVKRGGDVVAVISDADLAAHLHGEDQPDPLLTTRQMEVELPRQVTVSYLSAATDYATATKPSRRLVGAGKLDLSLDVPLVLSDTKAQEMAEVNLYVPWLQRLSYGFTLPRRYPYLEPTDPIIVKGHTMRITKITATARGVLQCEAMADDADGYAPNVIVTETPPNDQSVFVPGPTRLELM